jgi:dolichol-phosphate mannosyltransferase
MSGRTLIVVATYNEADNAPLMCEQIAQLALDADVLFVDDNSPDGTGRILEALKPRYPRLLVRHRAGKLGVGSAHREAIDWAYDQGYRTLVTMDGDFSHSPADIPAMIEAVECCDVSVASRWTRHDSLPGWNLFRRFMTTLAHLVTKFVLGVPQDATGAFRVYRLDRVPREVFVPVKSVGYSFFFESLFIIHRNGFTIAEVPIVLPARTYGHSKMTAADVFASGRFAFALWVEYLLHPDRFLVARPARADVKVPVAPPS